MIELERTYKDTIPANGCLAIYSDDDRDGIIAWPVLAFAIYECNKDEGVSIVPLTINDVNRPCFEGYGSILDANTFAEPKIIKFVDIHIAEKILRTEMDSGDNYTTEEREAKAWEALYSKIQNSGVAISDGLRSQFERRGLYNR